MVKHIGKAALALVIYIVFAIYLYQPYFEHFKRIQYLLVVNVCLAALGCFVLSWRWVSSFTASFFAGVVYGFGPFLLGLAKFHPSAGFLAATVPWLFLPAAFGPRAKWRWLSWPLSAIPFLAVVLFFQAAGRFGLFPIPIQTKLYLADLRGLAAPIVLATRDRSLIGFYHIPVASVVMGFSMLVAARRYGVMAILVFGGAAAFFDSFFGVSPIIWAAIAMVCCSVVIGVGTQGIISAGSADRKWLLAAVIVMGALAITSLLLAVKYYDTVAGLGAGYGKFLVETAKMYILGAITIAIVFFLAKGNLRVRIIRIAIIASAMAIDIFLGARFIVDQTF